MSCEWAVNRVRTMRQVDLITALSFVASQMELAKIMPAMHAIAEPLLVKMQSSDGYFN